jgi:hypothetical protein
MLWKAKSEIGQILRWMPVDEKNNDWKNGQGVEDIHAPLVLFCISSYAQ